MHDLYIEAWGTGTPVVLVHGSLATGTDEWRSPEPAMKIQFAGKPLNDALLALWRSTQATGANAASG